MLSTHVAGGVVVPVGSAVVYTFPAEALPIEPTVAVTVPLVAKKAAPVIPTRISPAATAPSIA